MLPDDQAEIPFAALRDELAAMHAPPGVRKELMAEFAKLHRARPWYQLNPSGRWRIAGGVGSVAAAGLVAMLALHAPSRTTHEPAAPPAGRGDSGAFIALDSFERIELEPVPRIVEATVPRTTLASLGIPVSPENAGDLVHAEMLVGADGHPLALRLAVQ
jgi:hypothetical protein